MVAAVAVATAAIAADHGLDLRGVVTRLNAEAAVAAATAAAAACIACVACVAAATSAATAAALVRRDAAGSGADLAV